MNRTRQRIVKRRRDLFGLCFYGVYTVLLIINFSAHQASVEGYDFLPIINRDVFVYFVYAHIIYLLSTIALYYIKPQKQQYGNMIILTALIDMAIFVLALTIPSAFDDFMVLVALFGSQVLVYSYLYFREELIAYWQQNTRKVLQVRIGVLLVIIVGSILQISAYVFDLAAYSLSYMVLFLLPIWIIVGHTLFAKQWHDDERQAINSYCVWLLLWVIAIMLMRRGVPLDMVNVGLAVNILLFLYLIGSSIRLLRTTNTKPTYHVDILDSTRMD